MKLLITLLLSISLQAASFGSVTKKIVTNRWVVLGLVETAIFFDAKSTFRCVDAGTCHETNSLLPNPTPGLNRHIFRGIKIGEGVGFALTDFVVRKKAGNNPAWLVSEYGIVIGQGAIDYHNWRLVK